tara:strand:- start:1652 stop:1981 length:330 start_codon:yes stop_codon:yes gene_type:complete
MFNPRFIVAISIFILFLVITSAVKNKTRILEKQISNLNIKILNKQKDINETQLDFYYLTSPAEIEKKLKLLGFEIYKPIKYSNIFFDISHLTDINNKVSKLKTFDEKEK